MRSTATATAAISSPSTGGCSFGVFQNDQCFRTTCTLFPLPISFEARSYCATHDKRKLSLRIFQINRELAFGQDTYSPYSSSCEGHFPGMAVSVMPIPAWLSDASHEVILPEVIIVLHFSPCWYLLRTFLRSDKLRPNGGKLLTLSNP